MNSIKIRLKKVDVFPEENLSRILGPTDISKKCLKKIRKNEFCLGQLNLAELPPDSFPVQVGTIYFLIDENAENGRVIYDPKMEHLQRYDINYDYNMFIMYFEKLAYVEGMKLLGRPAEINQDFNESDVLLFQFDPLENEEIDFLESLDGVINYGIRYQDFIKGKYHKAYFVKDFT